MLRILPDEAGREELGLTLDEICLEGARRMLIAALLAEVDTYVEAASGELSIDGRLLVEGDQLQELQDRLVNVMKSAAVTCSGSYGHITFDRAMHAYEDAVGARLWRARRSAGSGCGAITGATS